MVRSIISVIVGYIAMVAVVFIAFTAEYMLLGPAHAFKPESYVSSNRWIAIAFVVNFVAAVVGGLVCAAIAKGGRAPLVLAILVFVLGLASAGYMLTKPRTDEVRPPGDLPMAEAMQKAQQPLWIPFTFPIVGVVGVLVGSKLKRRS